MLGVEDKSGKDPVVLGLTQRTALVLRCMVDRAAVVWAVKMGYADDVANTGNLNKKRPRTSAILGFKKGETRLATSPIGRYHRASENTP